MPRVLFYVQHLLGVGHLYRALHVSRAIAAAGLQVDLVSGGLPVPGLDTGSVTFHSLPPVMCRDGNFSALLAADGAPAGEALKEDRRRQLLSIFDDASPAVVIVESFPFGRRQMRFELLPLLKRARAAKPPPVVVCSVRDILQVSNKPNRADDTLSALADFFDHVLVHGDRDFAMLDETFARAREIPCPVHYTGMVADPGKTPPVSRGGVPGEVLVSAGGGAEGADLLAAALEARPLTVAREWPWRLLAGPNLAAQWQSRLVPGQDQGVVIEPNRPDFPDLLADCAVSVSQAGYNTAVNLFQCGCRSVLVPYAAHGQTEQIFRALRMQERGLAHVVEPGNLDPAKLADAIGLALSQPPPGPGKIALAGAENSAQLVAGWVGGGA